MTAAKVQAMPAPTPDQIRMIPLTSLHPASWNARKTRDERAMQELTASVELYGIQVPLLVRTQIEGFEIVAGHRRFDALLRARGTDAAAPCIVRTLTDDEARELGLIDNVQRENVPPMEEAEGLGGLLQVPGATIETVAARVGKSATYVGRRLKLLDAIEPVRQALKAGAIEVGHALELARLPAPQQANYLEDLRVGYNAPRKNGSIVEASIAKSAEKIDWQVTGDSVSALKREIERRLLRVLGDAPFPIDSKTLPPMPCEECPKRTGNQSLLFGDLAKDLCTDSRCYDNKFREFVTEQQKELKAHKRKLYLLANGGGHGFAGEIVYSWQVKVVDDESCGRAEHAIWIDEPQAGKRVLICFGRDCKKHGSNSNSSSSSAKSEPTPQRKALLARVRCEKAYRSELFKAIARHPAAKITPAQRSRLIVELAKYAIGRSDSTKYGQLAEATGLSKYAIVRHYGNEAHKLKESLAKLGDTAPILIALLATESGELTVHEYSVQGKPSKLGLEDLAGAIGVDAKSIRKRCYDPAAKATAEAPPEKKGQHVPKLILAEKSRKRIAEAQKKRWTAAKKAAQKGGRK